MKTYYSTQRVKSRYFLHIIHILGLNLPQSLELEISLDIDTGKTAVSVSKMRVLILMSRNLDNDYLSLHIETEGNIVSVTKPLHY